MKIVLSKLLLNLSCYLCQFFVSWWSYSDCLSHSVTQPGEITSRRARLSWLMYGTRRWMRLSGDLLYTLALVDGDWSTILNMESEEAHRAVQDFQAIVVLKHNWCTWHFSAPGVEHVFVLKASPVTYLFWIWLILPYIVPRTRIRMLPHGQCSNPGENLVPLNVIHIYVE